jgi:very-short-patch-repair endonuclease
MSIVVEPFVQRLGTGIDRPLVPHGLGIAPPPARPGLRRQLRAGAERLLWNHLRDGRLGGFRFRRQHLIELYLADFVCPERRLVIELDSPLTVALAQQADRRRHFLLARGWRVIKVRDRDVLVDTRKVLETLRAALDAGDARETDRTGTTPARLGFGATSAAAVVAAATARAADVSH